MDVQTENHAAIAGIILAPPKETHDFELDPLQTPHDRLNPSEVPSEAWAMNDSLIEPPLTSSSPTEPLSDEVATVNMDDTLLTAGMTDSLDVNYAASLKSGIHNNLAETTVISENVSQANLNNGTYVRDLQASASNEIFGDGALDFLETAGGNTSDSELARQSLYVNFDPFVGAAAVPGQQLNGSGPRGKTSFASSPHGPPGGPNVPPGVAGMVFRHPMDGQSQTGTAQMIAQMQQKQQAIMRQQQSQQQMTETKLPVISDSSVQQSQQPMPQSFNNVTMRETPPAPFSVMKSSLQQQQPPQRNPPLPPNNPPNDNVMYLNGKTDLNDLNDVQKSKLSDEEPSYPPGSIVNIVEHSSAQRPVTFRQKSQNTPFSNKTFNRRSVPANMFEDREAFKVNMDLEQQLEHSGLPELPPVWESVIATYEGAVQVLLAKLKSFQEEAAAARQREARAIADQEELHRVFVNLHERFEQNKAVISTYKANQETLQRAFDEVNSEIVPLQQEMKRVQAANRLSEMKIRALENEVLKRKEENAELTKIVDDLIAKDT